jgi:alanyl-tRNA synthetase
LDLSCPEVGFGYERCRIFALTEQKKMFQKSSIYAESTGGQLRIKFFPENFFEGKVWRGVEDCGGSHVRRVGVISENSVTYRQRLGTLPLLEV